MEEKELESLLDDMILENQINLSDKEKIISIFKNFNRINHFLKIKSIIKMVIFFVFFLLVFILILLQDDLTSNLMGFLCFFIGITLGIKNSRQSNLTIALFYFSLSIVLAVVGLIKTF